MTDAIEIRVNQLVGQIREAISSTPVGFSSDPRAVAETPPYQALVELGHEALPFLLTRLREGDLFLNNAVLRIVGLEPAKLGLDGFVSEQQIAAALLAFFEPLSVDIYVLAVAQMPAARTDTAQIATVVQPPNPFNQGTAKLRFFAEQRA